MDIQFQYPQALWLLTLVPFAFFVPAAVLAVLRSPDSDGMGLAMLVCFGLGFAPAGALI